MCKSYQGLDGDPIRGVLAVKFPGPLSHYFRIPDFSGVFQDLCLVPGVSRSGSLNILNSGLPRVYTNPVIYTTMKAEVIKYIYNNYHSWYYETNQTAKNIQLNTDSSCSHTYLLLVVNGCHNIIIIIKQEHVFTA